MATLLENYKKRLNISESVYAKAHNGENMSKEMKLATAVCLDNVNRFMTEAFENSQGTQRSAMGDFKRFTLNLTTVALPNLIAQDLVIVYPMSSITGYFTYIQYVAGSNKGETAKGDVFNDPFRLGKVDVNYTAQNVVEANTATAKADVVLAWTPVVADAFDVSGVKYDVKIVAADGTVTYANLEADGKTVKDVPAGAKVAYIYDNVVIPQNDVPVLNAEMKSIPLFAKARRIAVYYSQLAAFQAKTDYGFDLGDQLAEKAVGQLEYEIDTEVTNLLIDNAAAGAGMTWSKTLPLGVNKKDHYEGFNEIVEIGKKIIYDKTKRFVPNYMLAASDILPVLSFINGWNAAPASQINGPYFAGTLNGIKVFVTPNIAAGKFVLGVNGDDAMSSAAVYAPYLPVIPTQLLQYNDGGTTQGFSTMYDLKVLNADLLVAGEITA